MASNSNKLSWKGELLVKNVEPPELFKKSKATDITILVGGKALHFAKFPLTQGSDVFAQMIDNSADQSILQLHDVAYHDMIMFLECLHPKTFESITDTNLEPVTSIAFRFKHEGVLKRCEEYIIQQFNYQKNPPDGMYPNFFFHLRVADKYRLKNAVQVGVSSGRVQKSYFSLVKGRGEYNDDLRVTCVKGYEDDYNFEQLSFETKFYILQTRLKIAEPYIPSNDPFITRLKI